MAKYHVFDHCALESLHWFGVVIKYGERMILAEWVALFEEKKCMKSCGCSDLITNAEKKFLFKICKSHSNKKDSDF